ncbi:hypothetical protein SUDANB121_05859 (plasmid) [Nocardiopsis dassonvillei]|uniref:hypothetical protein n=1 Tax=Nocardiopsis dassonvillei TaxID=2014 RepID=UPI003F56A9D5
MSRSIRMPSQDELPAGPQRRFMETLFRLWVDAGMPAMEMVSRAADNVPPEAGAASKETVRKMLTGKAVPHAWQNAEAVFVGLSTMAGLDPDRLVEYTDDLDDYNAIPDPEPARMVFRRLWAAARGVTDYAHGTMQDYTPPPKPGSWGKTFGDGPPF